MADTKSTFITRVVSAVLALAILLTTIYLYGARGLLFIATVVIVLGVREFSRMVFQRLERPRLMAHIYWAFCLATFVAMSLRPEGALLWFTIGNAMYMSFMIWFTRGNISNDNLLITLAVAAFGIIYCVLFPYFGTKLAGLENGENWFLFLCIVVFFGDIFAYFTGRWFGKRKFMPMISPNKTWAGALGGLMGSAFAGTIFLYSTFGVTPWITFLFCLVCGAAGQSGDLLMSLVKRVANVKDSGTIMPGHGGVLDRLDGIYIACPLVYAFALYVS